MIVGVPKEVKDNEYRVALTPEGARELTAAGHQVLIEEGAGSGSSIPQQRYERAGAEIVESAAEVWASSDMIMKVKEPIPLEFEHLREGQIVFTYLHLAASRELTQALVDRKVSAVAYETVQLADGRLPLLAPMSEVAGRMAPHVAARLLEKEYGGRGILMGGVSGVRPAKVLVLGAGMAGTNAAWIAVGMEAEVVVIDKNIDRLRFIDQIHKGRIMTLMSDRLTIEQRVRESDVVIGTVLMPGARAPKLVTEAMVASMRPGSVMIDIAIDQGGSVETSHMTTHSDPTYVVHDVVHYAVGNMPGAVPNSSTYALTNVTLPYAISIASNGIEDALKADPAFALGLNMFAGSSQRARRRRGPLDDVHAAVERSVDGRAASPYHAGRCPLEPPAPFVGQVDRFLDHLTVERGLSRNTVDAYRRDLRNTGASSRSGVSPTRGRRRGHGRALRRMAFGGRSSGTAADTGHPPWCARSRRSGRSTRSCSVTARSSTTPPAAVIRPKLAPLVPRPLSMDDQVEASWRHPDRPTEGDAGSGGARDALRRPACGSPSSSASTWTTSTSRRGASASSARAARSGTCRSVGTRARPSPPTSPRAVRRSRGRARARRCSSTSGAAG